MQVFSILSIGGNAVELAGRLYCSGRETLIETRQFHSPVEKLWTTDSVLETLCWTTVYLRREHGK